MWQKSKVWKNERMRKELAESESCIQRSQTLQTLANLAKRKEAAKVLKKPKKTDANLK